MVKFSSLISRKRLFSLFLVTAAFLVLVRLLHDIDRISFQRTQSRTSAHVYQTVAIPKRPKHVLYQLGTPFAESPYNAANKRQLTTNSVPNSKTKYIYWQAIKMLRLSMHASPAEVFADCPVSSCEVSLNNKFFQKADAIVVDDAKMLKQTPPEVKENRVLVYYNMRMPKLNNPNGKYDLYGKYWKSVFNWVWSYRLDSDIFEPFAYLEKKSTGGTLESFDAVAEKKSRLAVWIDPRVNMEEESLGDLGKNLQKSKSQNGVESFVRKLKKVMSIDTCRIVDLKAEIDDEQAMEHFTLSKYYFVLAFEWADCQDYITDLFFDVFDPRIFAIPVVRGGFNYTKHFPKEIFVDADGFSSPRKLAKHLEKVAANKKLYTRMLWRKSQYVKENGVYHAWCQLCDMLHRVDEDSELRQRYEDIHAWYKEGGGCQARLKTTDAEAQDAGMNATRYH